MRFKLLIVIILFIVSSTTNLFSQDEDKNNKVKPEIGIRYNFFYTNKVIHQASVFSIMLNKHNFYLGPEYSSILKPINSDIVDTYSKDSWGLNVGYRYYSNDLLKNLKLFGSFDFSIFQIKYSEYQHGLVPPTEHKQIIIENTVSIGAEYKLGKKVHLFSGVGFGSYNGFFLMLDAFTLTFNAGLEYRF